jgi:hypothetical protein
MLHVVGTIADVVGTGAVLVMVLTVMGFLIRWIYFDD